jgi:hypothetical protein
MPESVQDRARQVAVARNAELKQNGCRNYVKVDIGEYGSTLSGDHVIQVIISEPSGWRDEELEWAALTIESAEDLRDELDNAIRKIRKTHKGRMEAKS